MENRLAGLSLDEEEDAVLQIQSEQVEESREETFRLVGCFLTASVINFAAMKDTMANLWHPVRGVNIRDLGEKRYLFQFYHKMDQERVLKGCPWTFNNHLLVLHVIQWGEDPLRIPLIKAPFWIQIHDIPTGMKVAEMGWDLSLRVQSRRAVPPSSVWLREEEIGQTRGNTEEKTIVETDARDKEEGFLIGEEGKKRARGEMISLIGEGGEKTSVGWRRRMLEGSPRAIRRLRYMLRLQNPQMVFFMETKICRGRMERIRHQCRYVKGIEVDLEGTRGGLCLAWKQGVNVTLRQFSKRHIDVVIDDDEAKGDGLHGRGEIYPNNIRERLDRGVANEYWQNMFPDGSIQHLTHSISDHCPLLVKTRREECGDKTSSFKFEAWWLLEETFDSEVRNIWESSSGNLLAKLNKLQFGLRSWASKIQGDQKRRKTFLNNRLSEILAEDRDGQNMAELIDTKVQLNLEIDKDERYWEQQERINWLKYGDKNTAFFHSQASFRKRKNMIQKMQSDNGQVAENIQDIESIARAYFQNLFGTEERECCNYLLSGIKRCITEEDNQILMAPYTKEEIREATFGMGPTKAPEEDGFLVIFYQQCWHIVKDEVNSFCLQVLNEGREFKQSAFVPGRLITDNILLAYEVLHTLKQKRIGRKGFMAVKLDISKAYDRGLASGRSISPFLFLMCGEGLSSLMRLAMNEGSLKGVKASRSGPKISHLLFADDCILFRGKEIFIKSILQAIPTYMMACFLLPKTLCVEIESIMAKFWWQKGIGRKGIHWCEWRKLCELKENGGLGFRNMCNLPSLTWRSIWATKGLLQNGMGWRVGRGTEISVWEDHWIPEIVERTFTADIAEKVLQIPLAKNPGADMQIWRGELSGDFSVRSAYKILQNARMDPSDLLLQTDIQKFYKKLWNLKLPSKLLITVWRASCGSGEENIGHVFRFCPATKEIWQLFELGWINNPNIQSFWDWITWVVDRSSHKQTRLFCSTIWLLWGARNRLVHEKKIESAEALLAGVKRYMAEIDGIQAEKLSTNRIEIRNQEELPSETTIFFDATFNARNKKSMEGLVVTDRTGGIIKTMNIPNSNVPTSFTAEAYAGYHAVKLGRSMGFQTVRIKGDSRTVIKKCQTKKTDKSVISAIISDIQELSKQFLKIEFQFINRNENQMAHRIAEEALRRGETVYLGGEISHYSHDVLEGQWRGSPD
ncbi:reverse transcriptase [Gossypium australe]|uniref:Reverse transcriptase n=1 Tax=Gossypium australe TaxID=47621 RepID=A0A5B6VUF1_9ROSI|nr:reverse transcriptase [Gossypium australe]